MSEKKEFIVLDPSKVFIIEGDKSTILDEGDFITPPSGYHSIIEQFRKKTYKSRKELYLLDKNQHLSDYFIFKLYRDDNSGNYIIEETFNQKRLLKFQLLSIKHDILKDKLDGYFLDIPKIYYENKVSIDKNEMEHYFHNTDKLIITLEFYYIEKLSKRKFTATFEYKFPFYSSHIKSKKSISNKYVYIIPLDLTRIIRHSTSSTIQENTIPTFQLKTEKYFPIKSFILKPIYIFFYYFDSSTSEYVIHEKIYPKKNSNIRIHEIRHNFLQSYLDETYSPPVRNIDRVVRVPQSTFETQLSYIDIIECELHYSYKSTHVWISNLVNKYYFRKDIYVEVINNYLYKNKIHPFLFDTNYQLIIKKRVFDGNYQPGGIQSLTVSIDYMPLKYIVYGPRLYESLTPSR